MPASSLQPLEEVIGYRFRNPKLLTEALSHSSYASEARSGIFNERLEFLGDAILAAVIVHQLYTAYPDDDEGKLSKMKSSMVSRSSLAARAAAINLGAYLYLGVGEESSGGRSRQSLISNALEAIIGAVYLDGGYAAAVRFVRACCMTEPSGESSEDYKSSLQEFLQKKHKTPPHYELVSSIGPDHDRTFEAVVLMGKKAMGRGAGKTKKEAEQTAAKDALTALKRA